MKTYKPDIEEQRISIIDIWCNYVTSHIFDVIILPHTSVTIVLLYTSDAIMLLWDRSCYMQIIDKIIAVNHACCKIIKQIKDKQRV